MTWWSTRWSLVREAPRDVARWAAAELCCGVLTLGTLAWVAGVLVARAAGVQVPDEASGPIVTLLLAGALGYGTNFLAVQMLFRPLEPVGPPLGWVWRQGLVPARQAELAARVGEAVAERLLTPEALAEEIAAAVGRPGALDALAEGLWEAVWSGGALQQVVTDAAAEALTSGDGRAQVVRTLNDALSRRLDEPDVQAVVGDALRSWLKVEAHSVVRQIRRVVKEAGKGAPLTGWAGRNLVDWDDMEDAFVSSMRRSKGGAWARSLVPSLRGFVGDVLDVMITEDALRGMASGDGAWWQDEGLRDTMLREVVPVLSEEVGAWIRRGGMAELLSDLDVQRMVQDAAMSMAPAEIEELANEVAARHLGAIQVLGYALGLLAGAALIAL